jgi:hypothetical protein
VTSQPGYRKEEFMTFWDGTRWVPEAPAAHPPRRTRRLLGAAAEAMVITSLIFGLIAGSAMAAKGGKGRTSASLDVSPDVVAPYGVQFDVTGSGFRPGISVNIVISSPNCCAFTTVDTDGSGAVWFLWTSGDPGTYKIDAYQRLNGKKLTLMGSTTFQVATP